MARPSTALLIALVTTAIMGLATESRATTLTFDFNTSFGAVPSDGTSPWLRAVFDDVVSPGKVRLTMSAIGLSTDGGGVGAAPEFADTWWFNLNPSLNADSLVFAYVSGYTAHHISTPDSASGGELRPDGDHTFDIFFHFKDDPDGDPLRQGETSVYDLSGIAGLKALDFNYLSQEPGGSAGPFLAASHIQSTGDGNLGSDYVAPSRGSVPEPIALTLLGLGLAALAARRRH